MKFNEAEIIREAIDYLIDGDPVNPNEQSMSIKDAVADVTNGGVYDTFKQTQEEFDFMLLEMTKPIFDGLKAKIFAGRMTALQTAGWNVLDDEWLGGATGRNNLQISLQCDPSNIIETIEVSVDTMYLGAGEGLEAHELEGTEVYFDYEGHIPTPAEIRRKLIERFTLSIPD